MTLVYAGAVWLITLAIALGTGFHYGGKLVKADWDAERVHIAQVSEQERTRIVEADKKADVKVVKRKAKRKATQQSTTQGVVIHAESIPDPVQCHLAPERVSNINAAFGLDPAHPRDKAPAVPAAATPEKRKP